MRLDLSDKTIIITGAFGGIAEAMVNTLVEAGAFLILTDKVSSEEAATHIRDRGHDSSRCTYREMDVTDRKATASVINELFTEYPAINIALGHAGGTSVAPFRERTPEAFDQIFDFNFKGQVHLSRPVLEQWVKRQTKGHMIYTSSFVSQIPWQGISAYTAAKAALEMFAKSLALEYAADGIRFNILSPGNVATGSSQLIYDNDPEYRNAVDSISPLGHRNSAAAIANGFLYLCSHLADEVDGTVLAVDAGVSLPKLQQ